MAPVIQNPTGDKEQKGSEGATPFSDATLFAAANTTSTINAAALKHYHGEFQLPKEYRLSVPKPSDRMYKKPFQTLTAVSTQILRNGVRFPLHPFLMDFLSFVGIGLTQLVPNAYIHLICFIAACHDLEIRPALDLFFGLFTLTKTKEQGFRALNRLPGQRGWMLPPSSNKGWHSNWFYASGPDTHLIQGWGEAEKPALDPLSNERKKELRKLCDNIPTNPWELTLLANQKWLQDHGLIIRAQQATLKIGSAPSAPTPTPASQPTPTPALQPTPTSAPQPTPTSAPQPTTTPASFLASTSQVSHPTPAEPPQPSTLVSPQLTSPAIPLLCPAPLTSLPLEPPPLEPLPIEPFQIPAQLGAVTTEVRKRVFDLTASEKLEFRRHKRRRPSSPISIHTTPVTSTTAPLTSPARSPPPVLAAVAVSPGHPQTSVRPSSPPLADPNASPDVSFASLPTPSPTHSASASDPGHSTSSSPLRFSTPPNFSQLSFFPSADISSIPTGLYQLFNLPSDNPHFPSPDPKYLLASTSLHLGRALGGFSRLLDHQNLYQDQIEVLAKLQADLSLLRQSHDSLHEEHTVLQERFDSGSAAHEAQLRDREAQEGLLRADLAKLQAEHSALQQQSDSRIQALQRTVADLEEQGKLKDEALQLATVARCRLEEANLLLETQRQTLIEDSRPGIIEEYQRSQELTDAVADQFNQGYLYAKGMIRTAGQNPKDLGFSSDEEGGEQ